MKNSIWLIIYGLFKSGKFWIAISEKENNETMEFDEENFELVSEQYLITRIPKLKGNLDQPNETIINVDYDTGEVNFNTKHFHFGIPTHSARASRQANTEFSYIRWLKYNKSKYYKLIYWVIAFVILGKLWGWFFFCLIPIPIILRYLIDSKERDMYQSGALLPGIVIDQEKSHIAVLTDLSLGSGSYPLIKIEHVTIPTTHKKVKEKLAIAGAYQKTENYPHWSFFEPLVMLCGMKFPQTHSDKIRQIPSIEWIKLSSEIKKLDKNIVPGYYPIDIEESDWKNIEIEKIDWVET